MIWYYHTLFLAPAAKCYATDAVQSSAYMHSLFLGCIRFVPAAISIHLLKWHRAPIQQRSGNAGVRISSSRALSFLQYDLRAEVTSAAPFSNTNVKIITIENRIVCGARHLKLKHFWLYRARLFLFIVRWRVIFHVDFLKNRQYSTSTNSRWIFFCRWNSVSKIHDTASGVYTSKNFISSGVLAEFLVNQEKWDWLSGLNNGLFDHLPANLNQSDSKFYRLFSAVWSSAVFRLVSPIASQAAVRTGWFRLILGQRDGNIFSASIQKSFFKMRSKIFGIRSTLGTQAHNAWINTLAVAILTHGKIDRFICIFKHLSLEKSRHCRKTQQRVELSTHTITWICFVQWN